MAFAFLVISVGWPGIAYTDTYFHYADILNGIWTNWHSPLITAFWAFLERFSDAPGNYFIAQVLFATLSMFVWLLLEQRTSRIIASSLIFFTPTIWMSTAILWKDVLMMYALLSGFAFLCLYKERKTKLLLISSLIAFICACSFRINAFFALPPLLYFLFPNWWKTLLATFFIALLGNGINSLLTMEKKFTAQTLLNYDLVGIIVNGGQSEIPSYHQKGQHHSLQSTIDHYSPEGVNRLFYSPDRPLIIIDDIESYQELKDLWLKGILANPLPYLEHRSDTFFTLLRWQKHSDFYYAYQLNSGKNPWNWTLENFSFRNLLRTIVNSLKNSYLYTPWMFLIFGLMILGLELISGRKEKAYSKELAMILSGFSYLIPLFFIVPAFDFRYMLWTFLAIHLSAASFIISFKWRIPSLIGRK